MPSRRDILSLFGLGFLSTGPLAMAVALDKPEPPKPEPIVRVRSNGHNDEDASVVLADGRSLWGVCNFTLLFQDRRLDKCIIEFFTTSNTGMSIARNDPEFTSWAVQIDKKNNVATVIDETGKPVEGVKVIGCECEVRSVTKWSVLCDCEVEWIGA
jgi:hypothetical protein